MPRRAKIVLVVAVLLAGLLVAWQFRKSPGEKSTATIANADRDGTTARLGLTKSGAAVGFVRRAAPSHTETQTTDVDSPAGAGRPRLPVPHEESSSIPVRHDSSPAAATGTSPSPQAEKPADTMPDHTAAMPDSKPAEATVPELPANFSGADRRDSKSPFDLQADSASDQPERTHKIVDGDSLASLAERYLGSANRAAEIFACNRDVLSDPELLPIGVRLRIPTSTAHPADNNRAAERIRPPTQRRRPLRRQPPSRRTPCRRLDHPRRRPNQRRSWTSLRPVCRRCRRSENRPIRPAEYTSCKPATRWPASPKSSTATGGAPTRFCKPTATNFARSKTCGRG